jgi:hypothetical protein
MLIYTTSPTTHQPLSCTNRLHASTYLVITSCPTYLPTYLPAYKLTYSLQNKLPRWPWGEPTTPLVPMVKIPKSVQIMSKYYKHPILKMATKRLHSKRSRYQLPTWVLVHPGSQGEPQASTQVGFQSCGMNPGWMVHAHAHTHTELFKIWQNSNQFV